MSDLEAQIKALEDWQQALARTFLAPPQPQQKPAATNDPLVCPLCGKPKKADFKQCYSCYEKAHPK
jgi:hypothetical protein